MEQFQPKTPEELQKQINTTTETLETSIVQESTSQETIGLSLKEIKSKYPERYQVYLKIIRAKKNNQEIDQKELEEMNTWISALNNLDTYITTHKSNRENLDSRSTKQLDVFEDIRNSLEEGKKEGYIKLPTGVGKTVLFSKITEALGLKTLVVVPSKILVNQTGERMEQFTDVEFGKFYQEEKDLSKDVTIITYNSLIAGIKNGTIKESEYDALILDEAHKALGDETVKAIDKFSGVKLGFTATPKYSRKKHVSDLLEHEIHTMRVFEAVQERLISRFKSYIAYTDVDLSKVDINSVGVYDPDMLEKAIDKESRNMAALELYKNQFEGQCAIAYCGGVDHSTHVKDIFNEGGISAEAISGKTPKKERIKILKDFHDGKIKVICNARILIEGFDEPKASVCLNLHPTLSYVDAEQRAGRVLRLDPDNSEKWGYIVDFIDKNPKVSPITFSEIAQASRVDPDESDSKNQKLHSGGGGYKPVPNIQLTGLKLVVDAQEVLSISNEIENERFDNKNKERWPAYEIFRELVLSAGIETSTQYLKERKNRKDWPKEPERIYPEEWKSWPEFFGREKTEFINYEEFIKEVGASGIKTIKAYLEVYKEHKGWPSRPESSYQKHWKDWHEIFGTEKRFNKKFLSYSDIQKEIKEIGILDQRHYGREYKKHKGWPSRPDYSYSENWKGWDDFLDREKPYLEFEDLMKEVYEEGINSRDEYQEKSRLRDKWPYAVPAVYGDKWKSWPEFFGREKRTFLPYEEMRRTLKEEGVNTEAQYRVARKKHSNWPAAPNKVYREEWLDWPTFFSRNKIRK